jgi:hypothetical protein
MAYETTKVPVGRTQDAIRKLLIGYPAVERVSFAEAFGAARSVGVEFVHDGVLVRVVCPIDEGDDDRRVWRVVYWSLKSRFEAIDDGLEVFEQAFLAHVVDPSTNRTVYDVMRGQIEAGGFAIGGSGMKAIGG